MPETTTERVESTTESFESTETVDPTTGLLPGIINAPPLDVTSQTRDDTDVEEGDLMNELYPQRARTLFRRPRGDNDTLYALHLPIHSPRLTNLFRLGIRLDRYMTLI